MNIISAAIVSLLSYASLVGLQANGIALDVPAIACLVVGGLVGFIVGK